MKALTWRCYFPASVSNTQFVLWGQLLLLLRSAVIIYTGVYICVYMYLFLRVHIFICTYINQLRPQRKQFFWMLAKIIYFCRYFPFFIFFIFMLYGNSFCFSVAYFGMELHFLLSKTNGGNTKIKWNKSSWRCCVPLVQQQKRLWKRTEVDLIDISTVIIRTILIYFILFNS